MFSLVIPFYNEADCVEDVVTRLVATIRSHHLPVTLILVNNGSHDRTGTIVKQLQKKFTEVRTTSVNKNQGYGYGIRHGLTECKTPYVGFMCGDGQTDPKDVVRVVKILMRQPYLNVAKVVRKIRHDSISRRIVSFIYNLLFSVIFMYPEKDVNGTPKVFTREVYKKLQLTSNDWFIDAECMLKARLYNFRLKEIPTKFYERKTGTSSVNFYSMIEFLKNILIYRLKLPLKLENREVRLTI